MRFVDLPHLLRRGRALENAQLVHEHNCSGNVVIVQVVGVLAGIDSQHEIDAAIESANSDSIREFVCLFAIEIVSNRIPFLHHTDMIPCVIQGNRA